MIYTAIDFETADYGKDSACALGLVKIQDYSIIDSYYCLIRPPRPKVMFTDIHNLTWDMLRDKPSLKEQWQDIAAFLQDTEAFIAHNAPFDRGVLYGTAKAYAIQIPEIPFYCTLKGARKFLNLPHNSLNCVCDALHIDLDHHHALSDAIACASIFLYFRGQQFPLTSCLLK